MASSVAVVGPDRKTTWLAYLAGCKPSRFSVMFVHEVPVFVLDQTSSLVSTTTTVCQF